MVISPLTLTLLALLLAPEAPRPLPAKHAAVKVTCHDCHRKEAPSMAAVADDSCMVCHGDYPAMAAYTRHLDPNPHAPPGGKHPAQAACVACHRQHRPPVVACLDCHPGFKLKAR